MERDRERNVSYDTYQAMLDFENKMIQQRLKAKRVIKNKEVNVQWNGHGYSYYPTEWPLKMITLHYEDIPPNGHNVEHKHIQEAVVFMLKGHGHAFIGGSKDEERATTIGQRIEWEAGDALMVPSGIWHVFYNDGDEWARFLGIHNPLLTYLGLSSVRHHGHEGRGVSPPDDIREASRADPSD